MDEKKLDLLYKAICTLNDNPVVKHMTEAMLANESGLSLPDVQRGLKDLKKEGKIKAYRVDITRSRKGTYYTPFVTEN